MISWRNMVKITNVCEVVDKLYIEDFHILRIRDVHVLLSIFILFITKSVLLEVNKSVPLFIFARFCSLGDISIKYETRSKTSFLGR